MKNWLQMLVRPVDGAPDANRSEKAGHRDLGDAARERLDWDAAARHYADHLETNPEDFAIWVQKGHALKEAGLLDQADVAYGSAARLNDQDADLWLNRGHLAKLRNDPAVASEYYAASYAIDGNEHAKIELVHPKAFVEPGNETVLVVPVEEAALASALGNAGTKNPSKSRKQVADLPREKRIVGSIDRYHGTKLNGWAVDPDKPGARAEVEVLLDDKVIASGTTSYYREDVVNAGYGKGKTGYFIELAGKVRVGQTITARLKRTKEPLANTPFTLEPTPEARRWMARHDHLTRQDIRAIENNFARETEGMLLSIVMPVYNTKAQWLKEAIDSVIGQWCPNWELICVDDASPEPHVAEILNDYAAMDPRIRVIRSAENGGISRATNAGIEASQGNYIALMDHDDYLEPEAVYRLLDTGRTGAGLIYCDEIETGEDIDAPMSFVARPAFSHDYYLSNPYFVHIVCVRTDIAKALGGFDETMNISADVDFVLRVIEKAEHVAHIPALLYRWRIHQSSTGHARANQVTRATLGALNRHLKRIGSAGVAKAGLRNNTHRIDYPDDRGRTLIIIPTKDRIDLLEPCLESIWRTTDASEVDIVVIDHDSREARSQTYFKRIARRVKVMPYSGIFNYALMNNQVALKLGSDYKYIVFMNNDIEAIESGWLERMRSLAGRSDVGVVGSTLLYSDERIQHAGVIIGIGGAADHAHKFKPFKNGDVRELGYNTALVSTRDYTAVTAACMMMRSEVFLGVDGFDEELVIGFNDTDICLRVSALGYRVLNDAHAFLYHHESATRSKSNQLDHPVDGATFVRRWRHLLSVGDPFYNPLLSLMHDHDLGDFTAMYHPARVRPVTLEPGSLEYGRARRVTRPVHYHIPMK